MIAQLTGILVQVQPPTILIDVSGVGYELQVSMKTLYALPAEGNIVTLLTHLVIREDAHLLYGFMEAQERTVFRELIKISGVGPKLALAILSSMDVSELVQCVESQKTESLLRVPGIGKKTAERLLIEMQDKFAKHFTNQYSGFSEVVLTSEHAVCPHKVQQEAISALIALGYKESQAAKAVRGVAGDEYLDSSTLIRLALQQMGMR